MYFIIKMSKGLIIGGIFLLMVVVGLIVAYFMMSGGEPEVPEVPEVPVVEKYRYVRIIRDKDGGDHWMNLAEVEVFSGGTNVASGKIVTQSSISHPGTFDPPNLVDGNKTNFAHTNNEAVEYFQIDLGQDYDIEKVVITNRTDCCQGRLRNTKIQLSKVADMSSPKESRVVTTEEAPKATITWMPKLGAELTAV
jgi:hypothetical protein